MTAYYNEFDPFAAQWLRNLIAAGLIADGVVDDRSITEVQPDDLRGYSQVHFFAGIGGWSAALRLGGWPDDRPVWTGSCPCQPFSNAGQQNGADDDRHLWPEFHRLIAQCRPATVFGEQVASADGRDWFAAVRFDLEKLGYAVGGADLCAAGVGAPHIRQRLWFVADAIGDERGQIGADSGRRGGRGRAQGLEQRPCDGGAGSRLGNASGAGLEIVGQQSARQECAPTERTSPSGGLGDANGGGPQARDETATTARYGDSDLAAGWNDLEWLPCIDGKARPTFASFRWMADGLSDRLVFERTTENEVKHGPTSQADTAQNLSRMRRDDEAPSLQGADGRSNSVRPSEVLQSGMHGESLRRRDQGSERREQSAPVTENSESDVRELRTEQQSPVCSPSRPQSTEQRDREFADTLRKVSQAGAFAELRSDHATAEAVRALFPARYQARLMLLTPDAIQEVWRSLPDEEKTRIILRFGDRHWHQAPFIPLESGVPGRVGMLRAYGNAIVPQVAAEFIGAYMDLGR